MRGLLIVAGLVPACTSGMLETTTVEQGACTTLEGRTFVSERELPCGPDGAVLCRWQLSFDVDTTATSQLSWVHSNVGEVGRVSCTGTAITATMGSRSFRATLDPRSLRLSWAGESYVAQ